jgi:hypothetical protein
MDVVMLINKYGFPIVMAVGMGLSSNTYGNGQLKK